MSDKPKKPKKNINKSKTKTPMREQPAAERIFNIMDMPSEVADHDHARVLDEVKGALEIEDVSFQYTEGEPVLKNIIAIAVGMGDGQGAGDNTRSALITRGLAEITRLGVAMGGRPETFAGLAGMGDLVLTCTGGLSRNRTLGQRLGRGESLDAILSSQREVVEGVRTTPAAAAFSCISPSCATETKECSVLPSRRIWVN